MSVAKSCLKCGVEMQSDGKFIWCEECDVRKYEMDSYYARPPEGTAPSQAGALPEGMEIIHRSNGWLPDLGVMRGTIYARPYFECLWTPIADIPLAQAAPTGAEQVREALDRITVDAFSAGIEFALRNPSHTDEWAKERRELLVNREMAALSQPSPSDRATTAEVMGNIEYSLNLLQVFVDGARAKIRGSSEGPQITFGNCDAAAEIIRRLRTSIAALQLNPPGESDPKEAG